MASFTAQFQAQLQTQAQMTAQSICQITHNQIGKEGETGDLGAGSSSHEAQDRMEIDSIAGMPTERIRRVFYGMEASQIAPVFIARYQKKLQAYVAREKAVRAFQKRLAQAQNEQKPTSQTPEMPPRQPLRRQNVGTPSAGSSTIALEGDDFDLIE